MNPEEMSDALADITDATTSTGYKYIHKKGSGFQLKPPKALQPNGGEFLESIGDTILAYTAF